MIGKNLAHDDSARSRGANACGNDLPQILSLFCGAGGLDWGFSQAGFPIALAVDFSKSAVRSYNRNLPDDVACVADLRTITDRKFLAMVSEHVTPDCSLGLIGGPPCQGFSRANRSPVPADPRNALPARYLHFVRLLKQQYKVRFVVFENVPGLTDKKHLATYEGFLRALRAVGLNTSEHVLCASQFGVAQIRRRVVVVGLANSANVSLQPPPEASATRPTVRDEIHGLPCPVLYSRGLTASRIPFHENHWAMRPKSYRFAQRDMSPSGRSFKLLQWDQPSPTIAFGHREVYVHPAGERRLSIYEAMRLQGFPKGFVLEGNLSEQVEQVSNAVPPPMAHGIAMGVLNALKGDDA
jgi:DNA (cytosine-5)-methyltransferase 1